MGIVEDVLEWKLTSKPTIKYNVYSNNARVLSKLTYWQLVIESLFLELTPNLEIETVSINGEVFKPRSPITTFANKYYQMMVFAAVLTTLQSDNSLKYWMKINKGNEEDYDDYIFGENRLYSSVEDIVENKARQINFDKYPNFWKHFYENRYNIAHTETISRLIHNES